MNNNNNNRFKHQLIHYVFYISIVILFSACDESSSEKPDEISPVVSINNPTYNSRVIAGRNLSVKIAISDNIALSDYALTINYTGSKSLKNVEDFTFNSLVDLDANGKYLPQIKGLKSINLEIEIAIDENAREGKYVLAFEAEDSSNNKIEKSVQFEILHP